MKKIAYILIFILFPLIASAQYAIYGNDPSTITTQRYIGNSPGNTPGNRRNIEIVKDSFYLQQLSWRYMFLSLSTNMPYDNTIDRIVVADDSGYIFPRALNTIVDTTTNLASKTWVTTRGYLTSQVNADWNAVSGAAQILNKPTIPAAQVNTDWNAVSGITQILNKPNYLDTTTNLASKTWVTTRGYLTSQVNADWNAVSGAAQILNKPTIPAAQVNSDWNAVSGAAQILNKPTIPAAQVNTDWNAVSGITQILNKPNYLDTTTNLASKTWVTTRGYLTSQVNADWNAVSGAAQILNKPTLTNGTVTSVGVSSTDLSVSGSPVTTSGSITVNLNTSGVTAGTYDQVTVNNKGIVTAGTNSAGLTAVTRPINGTTYTISSRPSTATYYIRISCTASIGSASAGSVTLQYSIDGGTNWLAAGIVENSNTVTLAVVLNSVTVNTMPLTWDFPANALVRMVSATTGTTSITYVNGGERAL